jgi:hypothetical protein
LEKVFKMANRKEFDLNAALDQHQAKLPPAKAPARASSAPIKTAQPPVPVPRSSSLHTPVMSPASAAGSPSPSLTSGQTKAQEEAGFIPMATIQEFMAAVDASGDLAINEWMDKALGIPNKPVDASGIPTKPVDASGIPTKPVDINSSTNTKVKEAPQTRSKTGKAPTPTKDKFAGTEGAKKGEEDQGEEREEDGEKDDPGDGKKQPEKTKRTKKSPPSNIHI